ncbi:PAS/PAC Sensor Signal Transduction Histidine Kinase [Nostoc sp. NIES-3756]|uniref:PAS domain-containing sensor histidine kinase n=1 Tax=Nostoc sp. NIES-3756 TaxID=1751286 RepID=UPI000720B72D|nr:PAS domain S-box protein [Nostoc sp. NIES-3756]BAT54860.1 PAS/PAC Sensor Signal Transduction Histidine Kinase [Nostoc sp. NIES-3756]
MITATNQTIFKSDRHFTTLVQKATVGIFRTPLSGNCFYVNERWCEISGLSLKQSLGQGWRVAVHPDDLPLIEAQAQKILPDEKAFKTEFRLHNPQGKITWVLSESVGEIDDHDQIIGYIGTLIDITERHQIEEVLISNAINHHTRADGRVKISVRDLGKYYEFTVADDRTGIPVEYHNKIFVIFLTLEPHDRKENTGMELAIVKKIVETEGGAITLKPVSGTGSTFRFTWIKRSLE